MSIFRRDSGVENRSENGDGGGSGSSLSLGNIERTEEAMYGSSRP
jgi:hypothetical protein